MKIVAVDEIGDLGLISVVKCLGEARIAVGVPFDFGGGNNTVGLGDVVDFLTLAGAPEILLGLEGGFLEFGDNEIFEKMVDVLAELDGAKIVDDGVADAGVVKIIFVRG